MSQAKATNPLQLPRSVKAEVETEQRVTITIELDASADWHSSASQ
jgi:hypothetical protein